MPTKILFELKNVSFTYQLTHALDNISFTISEGEKLVLLGANGSGKSTLLKILDGLVFPTQGIVQAFGHTINSDYFSKEKQEYDFRKRVGYIFQDSDVQLFSPTVWDEVTFAPLQLGLSQELVTKQAESALKIMEITHLKNRIPFQLSGGEKKKVAIACVLSYKPTVWLFDEPTSGLDPRSQSRLIDFIFEVNAQKNTVITATHDLFILTEIANRVIVLSEDHQIVADDTPQEILADTKLLTKHNLIHAHIHKHLNQEHEHIHTHTSDHTHLSIK